MCHSTKQTHMRFPTVLNNQGISQQNLTKVNKISKLKHHLQGGKQKKDQIYLVTRNPFFNNRIVLLYTAVCTKRQSEP